MREMSVQINTITPHLTHNRSFCQEVPPGSGFALLLATKHAATIKPVNTH